VRLTPDHHVLVFRAITSCSMAGRLGLVKESGGALRLANRSAQGRAARRAVFLDYAAACAAGSPEVQANERWWISQFADGVPALDLPTDRPRPADAHTRAGREDHVLPAALVAQVKKTGAGLGASLFATLLAGFDALLHRLTGQTDVVVASRGRFVTKIATYSLLRATKRRSSARSPKPCGYPCLSGNDVSLAPRPFWRSESPHAGGDTIRTGSQARARFFRIRVVECGLFSV